MPFSGAVIAGGIAAAGSVGAAAVSGAMAPSPSGGGGSYYVPTGLPTQDTNWQDLMAGNLNVYNQSPLAPYGLQSLQQGQQAQQQYGPQAQQFANMAGNNYQELANTLNWQGQQNFGRQANLIGAGQQVYQTALDPQNALYNRTAQQLQDQTGATNSMYGLGSSAAGAGVANQAMSNFNIDWQNQQLQRQLQGLQGYAGAAQTAGGYGQLGTSQSEAVPGYLQQAGQVPYQQAMTQAQVPGQLGGNYGSYLQSNVYGPAQGFQSQIIPYLNNGQGAQAVPYQNAYNNAQAMGGAVGSAIQGIGSNPQVQQGLASAFGNAFGGSSGGYGAQNSMGYGNISSAPYYSGGGDSYGFTMG